MSHSISGFGHDYELPVGMKTVSRLLGCKPIPRMGYEVEVFIKPNSQDSLRLGNFSGKFALFSIQPKSEWMRLYAIDPDQTPAPLITDGVCFCKHERIPSERNEPEGSTEERRAHPL